MGVGLVVAAVRMDSGDGREIVVIPAGTTAEPFSPTVRVGSPIEIEPTDTPLAASATSAPADTPVLPATSTETPATPQATPTLIAPTPAEPTLFPTATPADTATPSPTATPTITSTPAATATATQTPTPTATPTPIGGFAAITGPSTGAVGELLVFRNASQPANDMLNWTWSVDGAGLGGGVGFIEVAFDAPGCHQVGLSVIFAGQPAPKNTAVVVAIGGPFCP